MQAAKATNEKLGRGEPERLPLTGGKRETEEKPNTTSGPPKRAPTASSLAAKEVGSSARQVERAIALRREAPEGATLAPLVVSCHSEDMASPIEATPTLYGKDAERLLSDLEDVCSREESARRIARAKAMRAEMMRPKMES